MTDNRTTELLPCPFCGGEAHYLEESRFSICWVSCSGCGAASGYRATEAEAIEAWNTRAAYEMEDFFYLPKPKQQLFSYTTDFSFDDISLKANGSVDVYALAESVHKWQAEALNKLIVERICDVFKPERTCEMAVCGWENDLLQCQSCGEYWELAHIGDPNYCPNCGAKVVSA